MQAVSERIAHDDHGMPPQLDARKAHRIPVREGTELLSSGFRIELVDLSLKGAQVVSRATLRPNEPVRLVIQTVSGPVRLSGRVAWSNCEVIGDRLRFRAGIEFDPEAVSMFEPLFARVIERLRLGSSPAALPAHAAPTPSTSAAVPADSQAATGTTGPTILLAEDDPPIRQLISRALSRRGFRVIACSNGLEGLDAARHHKGRIDLLITDVVMPGLQGFELAAEVGQLHPEARVLMMSGRLGDSIAVRDGLREGRQPVLAKPFTRDQLFDQVAELLPRQGS